MSNADLHITSPPWFPVFHPGSPDAWAIQSLSGFVFAVCAVILAIVTGLVVFCLWRFRRPEKREEPPQRFGNVKLEIVWITIPLLLVAVIGIATVFTMKSMAAPASRPPDLIVRGHQWWWEVEYPQPGIVTANEIHLPAGRKWLVELEAADVIHDFWVPELARKMDMIPGLKRRMWLEADQPGVYQGQCAEFCGAQHAWMRFQVVAQSPADFSAWQAGQLQPAAIPSRAEAREGQQLFQQMTCVTCHAIDQSPGALRTAPNLAQLASRYQIAGGALANTPKQLFQWLMDPQKYKPGCKMPDLKLTDAQAHALVAYLEGTP